MKIDGIQLSQGSDITNLVSDHGTSFPGSPDVGELFYRSDLNVLYVYNGTTWQTTSGGGGVSSVDVSGGTTGLTTSGGPVTASGTITIAGTLDIANGGTGQTTKTAAFDALSPLATTGDTLYFNGTSNVALSIGSTGEILTVAGGVPTWAAAPATGVTSVAVASGGSYSGALSISGSPVTSTGTITVTPNLFTTSVAGIVPGSGGGTTNFLRADGTWSAPTGAVTSFNTRTGAITLTSGDVTTALGFTPGTGTVTSVSFSDASATPLYSISGTPVTTTGTLTVTLNTQSANQFLGGPTTGAAAQPSFRSLIAADIPALSYVTSVAIAGSSGIGVSGSPVTSSGTITISLGAITPSSVSTGAVTATSVTDSGLTANSFVYPSSGGLLASTAATTNGQLLIGSTSAAPVAATLTAGTAIGISNGAGAITINNTGVTALAAGTGVSVSASTGSVTVSNTGVTSITGTTNQVIASASTGTVTLSLPQSIATTSQPTFAQVTLSNSPVNTTDAATKAYVDAATAGLNVHSAVQAATTVSLTATYAAGTAGASPDAGAGVGATLTNSGTQAAFVVDGYTASVNDRILVKNQATTTQNGVYVVTAVGSGSSNWVLTRATDYDQSIYDSVRAGDFLFIEEGGQASTGWVQNSVGTQASGATKIGTDSISFTQFSGTGTYSAGTGLTLTGTTFSITAVGTASTYGSASQVPVFTTNAQGQVSSVTNTSIAIDTSAITSGTLGVTRGGTGTATSPTSGQILVGTSGGTYVPYTLATGTGISTTTGSGTLQINNTGVTSLVAGTNISVSGATGAVTVAVTGTVAAATTATNLSGGAAGSLPYQTGSGATSMLALGTTNYVLTAGSSAPQWTAQSSLSVGSATTATNATNVGTTAVSAGTTLYPTFVSATSGNNPIDVSTGLTFNASTNTLTTTTFAGALSGNATTATTATNATNSAITNNTSSSSTWYPTFVSANTGNLPLTVDSSALSFVPSTGTLSTTAASLTGNLNFTSTAQLITGDMSNATLTSRLAFQTSTTNGSSILEIIPNGSGTSTGVKLYSDSARTNASVFNWSVLPSSSLIFINSAAIGSGTVLPLSFQFSGVESMRLTTAGALSFGSTGTNYGTSGQVLTSNANASPSWTSQSSLSVGSATNATNSGITAVATNATFYPTFVSATTGNLPLDVNSSLTYNPSTATLSSTTFAGALSGNATTATTATNVTGGGAGALVYQTAASTSTTLSLGTSGYFLTAGASAPAWSNPSTLTVGTATNATNIAVTSSSSGSAQYPLFAGSQTGNNGALSSASLTFTPSTGNLSATTFTGALSGNATSATTAGSATNVNTTNNTSSALTWYPTFVAASSGSNPITVDASALTFVPSTGILSTTGINLGTTGSSVINISTANGYGGTNYAGFLSVSNAGSGATNQNKFFRINPTGGFEIVNSAYTAVIFGVSDGGALSNISTIAASSTVTATAFIGDSTNAGTVSSGTVTINWATTEVEEITLGASGLTIAFSNVLPTANTTQTMTIVLIQDGTGSRTLPTFSSTIKWDNGIAPVLTTTAGKTDIIQILAVNIAGTITYYGGQVVGNA
jgi:hypothetical protein